MIVAAIGLAAAARCGNGTEPRDGDARADEAGEVDGGDIEPAEAEFGEADRAEGEDAGGPEDATGPEADSFDPEAVYVRLGPGRGADIHREVFGSNLLFRVLGAILELRGEDGLAELRAGIDYIGLRLLRWPGGCLGETYHWRDSVGPVDTRPASPDPSCSRDNPHNPPLPNTGGTDEFLSLVESAGIEALISVNFCTGTAREAANWVEYLNAPSPGLAAGTAAGWTSASYGGADDAPGGYFAWLREFHGHPEPHGVRFWQVGNEADRGTGTCWTREAGPMLYGGTGEVTVPLTLDPRAVDFSPDSRASAGAPAEAWCAPVVPINRGTVTATSGVATAWDPLVLAGEATWTEVPDLEGSGPGRHFAVTADARCLLFGDGTDGDLLPAGHTVRATYATGPHDGFVAFADAMRAVDPAIRIGIAAPSFWNPADVDRLRDAAPDAFARVDLFTPHIYPGIDPTSGTESYERLMTLPEREIAPYAEHVASLGRSIFPTEWNLAGAAPLLGQQWAAAGLYTANLAGVLAASSAEGSAHFALLGLFDEERLVLEGFRGDETLRTNGLAMRIAALHVADRLVPFEILGGPVLEVDGGEWPEVWVLASESADGREARLLLVGRGVSATRDLVVETGTRRPAGAVAVRGIRGETPADEDLTVVEDSITAAADGRITFAVPPLSVMGLSWSVAGGGDG